MTLAVMVPRVLLTAELLYLLWVIISYIRWVNRVRVCEYFPQCPEASDTSPTCMHARGRVWCPQWREFDFDSFLAPGEQFYRGILNPISDETLPEKPNIDGGQAK